VILIKYMQWENNICLQNLSLENRMRERQRPFGRYRRVDNIIIERIMDMKYEALKWIYMG
jgi:hypothetical protein